MLSSVGVKPGSCFGSKGLLMSEVGVCEAGTGRVGSRPDGYERGSGRLTLDRDELDDAIDGAISLLPVEVVEKPVDVEKVDATERRDRNEEPVDDVKDEAKDDATELRPEKREPKYRGWRKLTHGNRALERTSSGSSAEDACSAGPRCVASTHRECRDFPPSRRVCQRQANR